MQNSGTPIRSVIGPSTSARRVTTSATLVTLKRDLGSERKIALSFLNFDALLKDPHLIPAGLDAFQQVEGKVRSGVSEGTPRLLREARKN